MKETWHKFTRLWYSAESWESPVPATALGLFRIIFGSLMIWEMIYFLRIEFVDIFLISPCTAMNYPFLSWVEPLPAPVMTGLVYLLLAAAVLITIGKWFRWAMLFFFVGFTYLFILDQAYYNNHLYLICLISFWMSFLPMDAALSIDKGSRKTVPAATYAILRFHLVLVYFFGGISKLNPDWLFHHEPVKQILSRATLLPDLLGEQLATWLLVYGGIGFDLLAGFLLLYRPTRKIGLAAAITFNVLNAIIFDDINIFPFFMLGSLLLFLEPSTVHAWFPEKKVSRKAKRKQTTKSAAPAASSHLGLRAPHDLVQKFFIAYIIFHCIWPFRHVAIPGEVDWTGQGQLFSWRMKIQTRSTKQLDFEILDYRTKTIIPTDLDAYFMNFDQRRAMAMYPPLLHQMAEFLGDSAARKFKHHDVGVRAKVQVSFNGRAAQYVVDPELDLYKTTYKPWGRNEWIEALEPY